MSATDQWDSRSPQLSDPGVSAFAVAKHDTNSLAKTPKAIYVGGAGDVALQFADGTTATFSAVPAGSFLPIRPVKVLATGTTATLILAIV